MSPGKLEYIEWNPSLQTNDQLEQTLKDLCEILILAVAEGAGVSFLHPVSMERAMAFWSDDVLPAVRAGEARGFLAQDSGKVVGCVMLQVKNPENQAHRGDVWKMLVHPDFRRRGIARSLLTALEIAASVGGKTLLTLDTQPNSKAFPLYLSMGYQIAGTIPNFARHSVLNHMESTTILYKNLQ